VSKRFLTTSALRVRELLRTSALRVLQSPLTTSILCRLHWRLQGWIFYAEIRLLDRRARDFFFKRALTSGECDDTLRKLGLDRQPLSPAEKEFQVARRDVLLDALPLNRSDYDADDWDVDEEISCIESIIRNGILVRVSNFGNVDDQKR